MSDNHVPTSSAEPGGRRALWIGYASACAVAWLLYVLAGAEFQRGLWQLWQAVYQATLALWPPMLLGLPKSSAIAASAAWRACASTGVVALQSR